MKLTPKTSFYGLLALLLVVLAVVVASLYWSKSQLDQRSETIDEKRQQTAELDSKIDAAIKLRQELEVKSELVTVTEEILPSSKSQETIVGEPVYAIIAVFAILC